jgi:hypothetical protein
MSRKILSTSIELLQTVNPDYTLANALGPAYTCRISSIFAGPFSTRATADVGNILLQAVV